MIIKSIKDLEDLTQEQSENLSAQDVEDIRGFIEQLVENGGTGKTIKFFGISDQGIAIRSNGDRRVLTVRGTPGAGFSLTIKDSTGCSLLEDELNDISIPTSGTFTLVQEFPVMPGIETHLDQREDYEVNLLPHADVTLHHNVDSVVKLLQYKDPEIFFVGNGKGLEIDGFNLISAVQTGKTSSTAPAMSISEQTFFSTTVVTSSSGGEGDSRFIYVKNADFQKSVNKDTVIEKVITRASEEPTSSTLRLKPSTPRIMKGVEDGDLTTGMKIKGSIEVDKVIVNSLDVESCKRKTDRFELDNVNSLFEGMFMYVDGNATASVVSVDCETEITLSRKVIIPKDSIATFKWSTFAYVSEVITNIDNTDGNAVVVADRSVYIPDGAVLKFDDDTSTVVGDIKASGSGTNQITLVTELTVSKYGTNNVSYSTDLSKIITRAPNVRDINLTIPRNIIGKSDPNEIFPSHTDPDSNAYDKRYSVTQVGSHGSTSVKSGLKSILYLPNEGFIGEDIIKYRVVNDGVQNLTDPNVAASITPMSDEKTIKITVR